MSQDVTTLPNGLRVVSHVMPHVETVSLGVWVASGARSEAPEQHGISHLLEHMAFKGTASRTAREIAEEIEQVGGDLNAATGVETTAYYARIMKADTGLALGLLADILQQPAFAEDELEREREVILQEIAASTDSPDDIAYDLVQEAAYPEQAIGRTILGTAESVGSLTAADLQRHLQRHYCASELVISAAGAVDHDAIVRHAEAQFGGLAAGKSVADLPSHFVGGRRISEKPFEQAHVMLGFQGPSYVGSDFYAAQVLSGILGGGMSSRLFQEVREKRGLCYSIYAAHWGFTDTGLFAIHAATGSTLVPTLIDVVLDELLALAGEGPDDRELQRTKAQLSAGLLMSLESSSARAEQLARHVLAYGKPLSIGAMMEQVEAVSTEKVRELAQQLLTAASPAWVEVGVPSRSSSADHVWARLARH